ncbi:MAG: sulfite exporter TauE/SafE family protein [Flavobacteriales bacterium]|nr:sulfite exporter TauE/SafE family protein [Flavobacteriales bacterium]
MSLGEIIALIIAGIMVGFINTLAGGGSIISLSILMFLGLPTGVANGTNRIAITLQTITATINFKKQNILDSDKGIRLAIPTVIGSVLGAMIAVDLNEDIFEKAIAVVMIVMVVFIFIKPNRWLVNHQDLIDQKITIWQYILFFFIGIYGGFLHIGIGYLLLTSIVLGVGYDLVKANAIKILIVMMYVPFSLAVFIWNDEVNYKYGFTLAIGNVIGAYVASKYAIKRGAEFVRWVILAVVLLTSANIFGIIDLNEIFKLIQ